MFVHPKPLRITYYQLNITNYDLYLTLYPLTLTLGCSWGVYGCALGRCGVLHLREDSAPQPHWEQQEVYSEVVS